MNRLMLDFESAKTRLLKGESFKYISLHQGWQNRNDPEVFIDRKVMSQLRKQKFVRDIEPRLVVSDTPEEWTKRNELRLLDGVKNKEKRLNRWAKMIVGSLGLNHTMISSTALRAVLQEIWEEGVALGSLEDEE